MQCSDADPNFSGPLPNLTQHAARGAPRRSWAPKGHAFHRAKFTHSPEHEPTPQTITHITSSNFPEPWPPYNPFSGSEMVPVVQVFTGGILS